MSEQPFRAPQGGRIDRARRLTFSFEGRPYSGFAGDTLASALLANGVRTIGRSFKYHRPRGLLAAGVEEPNALVEVRQGRSHRTNLRATEVELVDGLEARAVNCWPNASFDVGAVNELASRFVTAGFYYKTFMWPDWSWFEGAIRRVAGLGRLSPAPDDDRYAFRYAHCDVLVIGGGPAGLAAAAAAARPGVRVVLAEQDAALGGSLRWCDATVAGRRGASWAEDVDADLRRRPGVTLLPRTTALGYYDHNAVTLLERLRGRDGGVRERLWQVRARRVILASGALERPLVFPGNDRPGVMLAGSAWAYSGLWGVRPGNRVVLFTNNNRGYDAARAVGRAGSQVVAVVDAGAAPPTVLDGWTAPPQVFPNAAVIATTGRQALSSVAIRTAEGRETTVPCDALLVSGGWNPTVHLFSQSGGRVTWDVDLACFRPGASVQAERSVGAANGTFGLAQALAEGASAGAEAVGGAAEAADPEAHDSGGLWVHALWRVEGRGKAFVDFQNDVTAADIDQAARESFVSVEHLKRYTTLGMGADQGKTSAVNALAILGQATGRSPQDVGVTRFRPPFIPVSLGAFAGPYRGALAKPQRRTALHDRHVAQGGHMEEMGGWLRAAAYPRPGESLEAAIRREMVAVRNRCGAFDASPLGKIEVSGPDAGRFLDRIYACDMSSLKPGRIRYGMMLNELGVIIDDGVAARLDAQTFLLSTTSAGAGRIVAWLEEWLQCEWPDLEVVVAPVTEDWAVLNLAGPLSPAVLAALDCDFDPQPARFRHMSLRTGHVAGVTARVMRVSFSGEISYEVNVPTREATRVWDKIGGAGREHELTVFGVESLLRLRTEKGYLLVGADTDGTTIPDDVGWTATAAREAEFVGKRSLLWAANRDPDRHQMVGFRPVTETDTLLAGDHVRPVDAAGSSCGFVTSAGYSPTLRRHVAVGLLRGGRRRHGEELIVARSGGRVRVVSPVAYDPLGRRLDG